MRVEERKRLCRLLNRMKENKSYSEKVGLKDVTKYSYKNAQKKEDDN